MGEAHFCASCGGPLLAGSKFCGRCGRRVAARASGGGAVWKVGFVLAALVAAGALVWIFVFDEDPPPTVDCAGGVCPEVEPGRGATLRVKGVDGPLEEVSLQIPPGALPKKVPILISVAPPDSRPPRIADPETEADPSLAGPVIRFAPDGLRFDRPVVVTLPYEPEKIPPGGTPAVVVYDAARAERLEPLRVDPGRRLVEVALHHFSDAVVVTDFGRDAVFLSVGPSNSEQFGPTQWGVDAVAAPPEPKCDDQLLDIRASVAAGDYHIYVSPDSFWAERGIVPGERTMLWYLYAEDGGAMSSLVTGADIPIKPIRSGGEAELLRLIKAHITAGKPPLTPERLLDYGLRAVRRHDGGANLAAAVVTLHNVVRAIARADKWINDLTDPQGRPCPPEKVDCGYDPNVHRHHGHPPDDPMMPVFRDLLGAESMDGGPTFYEMIGGRLEGGRDVTAIMNKPFDPERGVFAKLEGANTSVHNGGSHYYHWIGAVGQLFHGGVKTTLGMWVERIVTKWPSDPVAGQVQGDELLRGRDYAKCIKATRPAVSTPPPCPELPQIAEKCPWSPDGFEVKPCPPGFCYDAGPRGYLACKQTEIPPPAFRNYDHNPECPPGMVPRKERCNPRLLGCDPASVGSTPTAP